MIQKGTFLKEVPFIFYKTNYICNMSLILNIETSTEVCSVAIGQGKNILTEKVEYEGQNHAKLLTLLIKDVLKEIGIKIHNLNAVAVSKGPGSYTGLRIGTSVAKGICYASKIPLIGINTLQTIANLTQINTPLTCAMIDARRMEVYCQFFDNQLTNKTEVEAKILDDNSFQNILNEYAVTFLGNGAPKFEEICNHPNAHFVERSIVTPLASQMVRLSNLALSNKSFEDTAYFTPFYLKKYQVTRSTRGIL